MILAESTTIVTIATTMKICQSCQLGLGELGRYCKCDIYHHEGCLRNEIIAESARTGIMPDQLLECTVCRGLRDCHINMKKVYMLMAWKSVLTLLQVLMVVTVAVIVIGLVAAVVYVIWPLVLSVLGIELIAVFGVNIMVLSATASVVTTPDDDIDPAFAVLAISCLTGIQLILTLIWRDWFLHIIVTFVFIDIIVLVAGKDVYISIVKSAMQNF